MSKKYFKAILLSSLALAVVPSARASAISFGIEPIIGYERIQKLLPDPHSTNRLIYGARATAGVFLLAIEAEYTHGADTEAFPELGTTYTDTAEKIKLGLRSGFHLGYAAKFTLRGGIQGERDKHDVTTGGVLAETIDPIEYHPYAGAGFGFALSSKVFFNLEVVAIIKDLNSLKDNDFQTTAGFQIRFP